MSNLLDKLAENAQSPLWGALQASLVTGTAGFVVGGTLGIAQSKPAIALWTIASTLQWAFLGGTYWGLRTSMLQQIPEGDRDNSSRLLVSGLASGASFAFVGAVIRGRQSILPGGIMGTMYGLAGQGLYNVLDRRHTEAVQRPQPQKTPWERIRDRVTASEWSPLKKISDEDYMTRLREQRLRIDANIALLDEEIQELEAQQGLKKEIAELRKKP